MASQVKIPFSALIAGSALALLSVNANTRTYGADGKVIEGVAGDPRIEVVSMDTLDRFSITVKSLDADLANMTEDQISSSLKNRQYINVELVNAFAAPYASRSGFGVSYSVKADSAKMIPSMAGFGKLSKGE